MPNKIPNDAYALIIGAMKCGTSSVYSYLERHPAICPACTKEPEFFSENQGHGADVDRYEDLWAFDTAKHRFALEGSTGYTKYPLEQNVPRNISEAGINPRFIYIIRNPFDRIASHYNFKRGDKDWELDIQDDHLINTSNYHLQLEQYRRYFPRDRFLILDFDALKSDPRGLMLEIYEFLGLEPDNLPEAYAVLNKFKGESAVEGRLRKWGVDKVWGVLPPSLKRLGKKAVHAMSPPRKRALSESERQYVHSRLAEGMANLKDEYGFDVAKWGF